jgi:hypothetical protein
MCQLYFFIGTTLAERPKDVAHRRRPQKRPPTGAQEHDTRRDLEVGRSSRVGSTPVGDRLPYAVLF